MPTTPGIAAAAFAPAVSSFSDVPIAEIAPVRTRSGDETMVPVAPGIFAMNRLSMVALRLKSSAPVGSYQQLGIPYARFLRREISQHSVK